MQTECRAKIGRAIPIIRANLRNLAPLLRLEPKRALLKLHPLNKPVNTLPRLLLKKTAEIKLGEMAMPRHISKGNLFFNMF